MSRTALIDADLEAWLPVKNYEGYYEVSSLGSVRSLDRYETCPGRHPKPYKRFRAGVLIKPQLSNTGYLQVGLKKHGLNKVFSVHRLVALAFVENVNNLPEVNHLDGDKKNNLHVNLEWTDRAGNSLHSTQVLKKNRGEDNSSSILTEEQILEIKDLLLKGLSQTEVASIYGVTNHAIHRIQHGYNWAWLTGFGRKGVNDV